MFNDFIVFSLNSSDMIYYYRQENIFMIPISFVYPNLRVLLMFDV